MTEDRFRRDFLAQGAAAHDPVGDLRRARKAAQAVTEQFLGASVWKDLEEPTKSEFDSLYGPVIDDTSALTGPVIVLSKAMVDAVDPRPLKLYLGEDASDLRQLQLLDLLVSRLGGSEDVIRPFRDLYNLRSAGGIAHLSGSGRESVAARVGIAGLTPRQAFDFLCTRLVAALETLSELITQRGLDR